MNLPNFLIIGAPKAGTSSLYYYLNEHPQIYMSPEKEPHFFSFENQEINFRGPGDIGRLRHAKTFLNHYVQLFDAVTTETAIGEASTTYLSNKQAPYRIKHYIPEVKLIAILRNPVDAAYASYLHLLRDGDESIKDFGQALQAEKERIEQNWEDIWHYHQRGFYYYQLKRYFDLFKQEQIKIYLYEDLQNSSESLVQDIFNFLEVDSSFVPKIAHKYNVSGMPKNLTINRLVSKPNILKSGFNLIVPKAIRNSFQQKIKSWNFNNFKKPILDSELRNKLTKSYEEDIIKLQDLIAIDLSNWLPNN